MNDKEKSALQKEIVASLPLKPHGRLLLAPRVGKSKLAIDIIKINKPTSILWVTPSAKLATEDIPAEFITWKAKPFVAKLTTVTWMSLDKVFGHFDLIILDEEQFATENNLQNLLSGHLKYEYIISMTGTSTSHDVKLDLYKKLNLPILYELSINDAVDIGMLANYSIKVIEVSLGKEKTIKAWAVIWGKEAMKNYGVPEKDIIVIAETDDVRLKNGEKYMTIEYPIIKSEIRAEMFRGKNKDWEIVPCEIKLTPTRKLKIR